MSEPSNVEIARRAWEAVASSDIDTLKEVWAPNIVWHVTGNNPWKGDHTGVEAVLDYLADVGEAGEAYKARLEDILSSRDRVMLLFYVTTTRGTRTVESQQAMLARIESGRIAEVWTLALNPDAFLGFYDEQRRKGRAVAPVVTA